MTSETTWLFRSGVAVRERGGVEVWRRQYALAPVADVSQGSICVGERADALENSGASEAAPSHQFTAGLRTMPKQQVATVTQHAADIRSAPEGNPSSPAILSQGDLFAEPNPRAPVSWVNGAESARKNTPVFQSGEPLPAAPFAAGSATSYAAAAAIDAVAASDAERVLRCIRSGCEGGRTCQEVERLLDMAHESASARVAGLLKEGRIIRTERTRPTASGLVAVA